MQVARYTFQSPYPSQVQVGRPDTSSTKSDDSSGGFGFDAGSTNQTLQDAKTFEASQTREVTSEVESKKFLDMYV